MTENTDSESAARTQDAPVDILSITSNEYSAAKIRSNLLHASIDGFDNDDVEFGVQVHQDGTNIALSSGTTWTPEDGPELYTYNGLTPSQAREIASALTEAADKAEEAETEDVAEQDSESLIRRLLP